MLPNAVGVVVAEVTHQDNKLNVFISYSRDDLGFSDQLDAALGRNGFGFDTTLDRHDITAGEDWKRRLGNLIRNADTVVFVLSPSSARSEICAREVGEAIRLRKRIIPVLSRPLDGASAPRQLADLNYIFFYEEPRSPDSGFGKGLVQLVAALNTDLDWLREHTRYLRRASEWDEGGRPANRLLFGGDIALAKAWAASRPKAAPEPTELHLDFIRASETEENRQQNAEAQRLRQLAEAQADAKDGRLQREKREKQSKKQIAGFKNFITTLGSAVITGWLVYEFRGYFLSGSAWKLVFIFIIWAIIGALFDALLEFLHNKIKKSDHQTLKSGESALEGQSEADKPA